MRQLLLWIAMMVAAREATAASFQSLGDLPGGDFSSRANGVSSDGSVVIGQSNGTSGNEAFRWTLTDGMIGLGDLSGGTFDGRAISISADGSVIVGDSISEAFRWTEIGGMVGLGFFPGGTFSQATDASADGSVVVGSGNFSLGRTAFRWTEADGMTAMFPRWVSR